MITDLELTQKILPKMKRYTNNGQATETGKFVLVNAAWLDEALSEIRGHRASKENTE